MVYDFSGKVVMITGGGRGIGRAIAEAFAKANARVALISKTDSCEVAAENMRQVAEARAFCGDVAQYEFVRDTVGEIKETWGRIDVLVNAAGILGPTGIVSETGPEDWKHAIQTNLLGVYNTIHETLPLMLEANRGKIINFAGGGAAYAYPRFTAYAASKVAVVRITETIAEEVTGYNIQVNVIAPGAVDTDMLKAVRAAGGEIRTVTTIDKPVKLVLFLGSDRSDHITGRFIHANDEYESFEENMNPDFYKLRRIPLR